MSDELGVRGTPPNTDKDRLGEILVDLYHGKGFREAVENWKPQLESPALQEATKLISDLIQTEVVKAVEDVVGDWTLRTDEAGDYIYDFSNDTKNREVTSFLLKHNIEQRSKLAKLSSINTEKGK